MHTMSSGVLVLLYQRAHIFFSASFSPRLINRDLKGHPIASRMYVCEVRT